MRFQRKYFHKPRKYKTSLFLKVQSAAKQQFFVTQESYCQIPTTKFHLHKALLLTELFTKIFRLKNLAVKHTFVYERIENTFFSWKKIMPLQTSIANTFTDKAPVKWRCLQSMQIQ